MSTSADEQAAPPPTALVLFGATGDLAARMVAIEGYDAPVIGTAGKPVGVAERYSDPSRIRDELGWRPMIALDDGIRRALEYARGRLERGIEPEM